MNLGLHVIHNPAGTFSFVGNLPTELATIIPATKSDVLGCRAFRQNGKLMVYKFPCFETKELAVEFAESKGFIIK